MISRIQKAKRGRRIVWVGGVGVLAVVALLALEWERVYDLYYAYRTRYEFVWMPEGVVPIKFRVFAKICGRFKHFDAAPERPALRADACFSRAGERSTRRLPRCPLSHPTLPFPRRENRGLCGPFRSASGPYFPGGFERAARETHPRILARRHKSKPCSIWARRTRRVQTVSGRAATPARIRNKFHHEVSDIVLMFRPCGVPSASSLASTAVKTNAIPTNTAPRIPSNILAYPCSNSLLSLSVALMKSLHEKSI